MYVGKGEHEAVELLIFVLVYFVTQGGECWSHSPSLFIDCCKVHHVLSLSYVSSNFSDAIFGNPSTERTAKLPCDGGSSMWKLEADSLLAIMTIKVDNSPRGQRGIPIDTVGSALLSGVKVNHHFGLAGSMALDVNLEEV